jgi:hypothetical protein
MGEVEAEKGMVTRHDLRHDRPTVSLLTDHIVFSPKYSVSWIAKRIKGRSSKLLRDQFLRLKEWCPDHLWAPSCYHGSVGHGWEVVERYISGQKGYEKTDTVPVIDEEKEKLRAHKTWYISLYNKLFGEKHQK